MGEKDLSTSEGRADHEAFGDEVAIGFQASLRTLFLGVEAAAGPVLTGQNMEVLGRALPTTAFRRSARVSSILLL